MKQKLNILVLSSWYPNRKDALDGNFIQNHVRSLALTNQVQVLFATSFHTKDNKYEHEFYRFDSYSEHYIYFPYHWSKLVRFFRKLNAYRIGIISAKPFDIIHANIFFYIGPLVAIIGALCRKKVVLTENSSQFTRLSHLDKILFWIFKRGIDYFVPVSSFLKQKLHSLGVPESNMTIAFNTVDIDRFVIHEKAPKSKIQFLHISRFDRDIKNVKGILKAIKILYQYNPNFVFQIIGDGELNLLHQMIEEINVPIECLDIVGMVPNENLSEYYSTADCFVLFSHFENNPLVLIEAMCCGVPVIASKVGGIPDFVSSINGILVEDNDIDGLVNALKGHIDKQIHYNAQNIRAHIVSKVGQLAVSNQYDQLFRSLISK